MSSTYYAQTPGDNSLSTRAVRACKDVLKNRLKLKALIGCGAQGCVYSTKDKKVILKVSAGQRMSEIRQIMWQKQRGWRSHTALPRVKKVYHLNRCAKRVGVTSAYVTVREDLHDVPSTPATRAAVSLLRAFEKELFRVPGTYEAVRALQDRFEAKHLTRLKRLHRSPIAWRIWTNIVQLQVWLAYHGLTMGDVKVDNLGVRKPSLQRGEPYDVVFRDMGLLQLRSAAGSRERARFHNGPRRTTPLGAFDADEFDVTL